MAPRSATRRSVAQNERLYTLGVQGRKTGITLPDTGVRDEHGMEPLDNMFSSPRKANGEDDEYSSDEQSMDIDNNTAPDPAHFLNGAPRLPIPLPKGRSPMRTNSKSPAKQNPHVGHSSSPMRGSIVAPLDEEGNARGESVKRRLNFSMEKRPALQLVNGDGNAGAGRTRGASHFTNGHRSGAFDLDEDVDDEDDEEALLRGQVNGEAAVAEESMNLVYGDDGDDVEVFAPNGVADAAQDEDDDGPVVGSATRTRGTASKSNGVKGGKTTRSARVDEEEEEEEEEEDSAPAKRKRGRPAASRLSDQGAATNGAQSRKRRSLRSSTGHEDNEDDEADQRQTKRPRTEPKPKGRKRGRPAAAAEGDEEDAGPARPAKVRVAKGGRKGKRKVSGVGDASVVIPRGPPLPKGPGLVISRREVPGDSDIHLTRSGRHSYKPIAFWKNEQVTWDQDETVEDVFAARTRAKSSRFLLPGIKEIHRVEEQQPEHKKKRRAGAAGRRAAYAGRAPPQFEDGLLIEDEEPADAWEDEVGRVMGQVAIWRPSFEHSPPAPGADVEVEEEQIAVSGAAIQTREIKDADFRFAKTLSLPYFGCGLVDMPPGSIKKQKNSRKMFMSFFVYTGRVMVTINETSFRISKGGMWFVPRGNYYSIVNDYDEHARLFFSQGCEIAPPPEPEEEEEGAEDEGMEAAEEEDVDAEEVEEEEEEEEEEGE